MLRAGSLFALAPNCALVGGRCPSHTPTAGACGHTFCVACLNCHFSHSLGDRRLPLRCPLPGCGCCVSCLGARAVLDAAATEQLDEVGGAVVAGLCQCAHARAVTSASWRGHEVH